MGVVSNFGGSVGKVEQVSPTHLRCATVSQTDQDHRNRQANWYYFELTNLLHAEVTIDLVNLAGEYSPAYAVNNGTRPYTVMTVLPGVRRQLLLWIDDNYFSRSTIIIL